MIKLKIDSRDIQVQPGSTILQAARLLSIHIPTMCHMPEFEHTTSCMICTVQADDGMLPACSTRAAEGMVVETDNQAVKDFRKTTLELLFSEHVGECVAPCELACPAHLQVPRMMKQIEANDLDAAIVTIREDIALPAVLGYICTAPCENACRRRFVDESASICLLKKSVALEDLARTDNLLPPAKPLSGKRIAIIGAGATGLAVAFYTRLSGHSCTVYDRNPEAGGSLHDSIGPGGLSREVLMAEVEVIANMGVEFVQDREVGKDLDFDEIRADFDAVAVAAGSLEADDEFAGLTRTKRGLKINTVTYEIEIPGVFAGGQCVRPDQIPVRSVADGKNISASIDEYLSTGAVTQTAPRVRSRLGKVESEEIDEFLRGASPRGLQTDIGNSDTLSAEEATSLSSVCLQCGCRSADSCQLRSLADTYVADLQKYKYSQRAAIVRDTSHPWVVFEPGKCIKCGLCVKITRARGEDLGLTFVGRGFDVRVGIPHNGSLTAALKKSAAECVDACPSGALATQENLGPIEEFLKNTATEDEG